MITSYTSAAVPEDLKYVFYAFLEYMRLPTFDSTAAAAAAAAAKAPIVFQKMPSPPTSDIIIFSTNTYTFQAQITEQPYHYSIKIGGKEFMGSIELFIDKLNKNPSKLAQVYSEPECWYQLGSKGKTVDMIKGSLQLCQMLFGANRFHFEDNSNVECGTTNHVKAPPRKLEKPFSLAHLSIAEKGKTWYELHFNAFLCDPIQHRKYRNSLSRLTQTDNKQMRDFESFAAINYLDKDQYAYIKPIYEATATWREFFDKIPKSRQCFALFNWLPTYMDRYILDFNLRRHEWCINMGDLGLDVESRVGSNDEPEMIRTDLFIHMSPVQTRQWSGRKGTRVQRRNKRWHTRRRGTVILSFSNQY
jgi:hypothetical protein